MRVKASKDSEPTQLNVHVLRPDTLPGTGPLADHTFLVIYGIAEVSELLLQLVVPVKFGNSLLIVDSPAFTKALKTAAAMHECDSSSECIANEPVPPAVQ